VLRRLLKLGVGQAVAPATIGGLPAAITELSLSGKPTRVAVVFLGKQAYAIGIQAVNDAAFRQHAAPMDAAMRSFHAITAEEREQARPLRMRVITARAGITFA
ncbi:MAG: hypothetical protein ACK58T_47090, partial [Phycisphaerae bacterium]